MKYDFTTIPDRSACGSAKWQAMPGASTETVPLTTADMEFPMAPEISEGIREFAKDTIYGYTAPTEEYFEAVCSWMERKHHYHVKSEWMIQTPGIVYALGILIKTLTNPGDGVILLSPVYYPFDLSILATERRLVYCNLKLERNRYSIDYELLEKVAAKENNKVLMFCNPHNPVGRVWDKEELEKVVDICGRHGVFIVDDEIHHDLIMPGYEHTALPNVSSRAGEICAVCTAPSKTFNLAGLQCSNIIIENKEIREKVQIEHTLNLLQSLNVFAYKACTIAYTQCDEWLSELIQVIQGNAEYVKNYMAEHFPEIQVIPLEGTYLLWVDMRGLGMTHKELEKLMKEDAQLYLDEGYIFGTAGRGFERFNIACSRTTLERALERFRLAVEKKREQWKREGKPVHNALKAGDKVTDFIYDTPEKERLNLAEIIKKPTVILFSRYYSCVVCQGVLAQLETMWPEMQKMGVDLKVVLQSDQETLLKAKAGDYFGFELICDPAAKLYDRYEVFEADSEVALIGENYEMLQKMGGVRQILYTGMNGEEPEGRGKQLPALFVILPDMTVAYAYYGQNMLDLPDVSVVMNQLKWKQVR